MQGLLYPRGDLGSQQRVPAQLEEIVAHPHSLHLEHLGPDVHQGLLQLAARGQVVLALQLADLQGRQGLAIELAVGVERQALQPQPVQRHHVLRQLGAQARLDPLQALALPQTRIAGDQVAHQVLAIDPFLYTDGRVADFRLFMQAGFDLAQFDAVATDLHLMVDPPDVLQHAVAAPACQVAGAVQAFARSTERMGHEGLHSAQRVADVATADTGTGHAQLAHRPQGHQLQGFVHQVQQVVVGGRADGQVAAPGRGQVHAEEGHVVGALRRAVGVDQADLWITQQPLMRQLRWHGLAGGQHPAQAVQGDGVLGQHALDQRRHTLQHRDALLLDVGQEPLGIMGDGIGHDVHPSAEQRRGQELPDRDIEALGGGLGDHIGLAQLQVRHLAQLVVEHAALLHHHALGQAGGTGGVDHVGEVVRTAVASGIVLAPSPGLDVFPDQQARTTGTAELVQQGLGLFTASPGTDQDRRATELDDAAQALARQARVQGQVAGPGLEAADDHAQQLQATLGQQGHRLVEVHALGHQGMAQAVAAQVQLGIAMALFQATGGDTLRMRGHLGLEQLHVAALQRVLALALVATGQQEITLLLAQQRQLGHVAIKALHQRQQQALELAQHALDGRLLEVALVIGQVQPQVVPRVADGRDRKVGVGAAGVRTGVQALGPIQYRDLHRGVLEHEQAVEQRLALGQLAGFLDRHQRQVLVLAQLHVAVQQLAQPLAHAAALAILGQLDPQGDAVDEQADGALHLRHLHRPPGHGDPEQHVAVAAHAPQDQGPGRLGEGVDGQLVLLRQLAQLRTVPWIEPGVAVADDHAAAVAGMLAQERPVAGDRRGAFEAREILPPPLARLGQALVLQPADVVAVARRYCQLRLAAFAQGGVDLEEVVHQQRTAPGIDEDVVVAHHEPVARGADTDQPQVERRLVEQIETGLALGLVQGLQPGFLLGLRHIAPVQVLDGRAARLVDNLQHVLAHVPAERGAQGFMPGHHGLPGLGKALGVQFAVDAVAVLHVVEAGTRFQQGVQQHAFLHRRQRIDILDLRRRYWQGIELGLGQARQGEVRRRQATGIVLQAMGDQALQLTQVGRCQLGDQLGLEALGAVGPAQHQFTAVDLAVDAQLVGQRCLQGMGRAD